LSDAAVVLANLGTPALSVMLFQVLVAAIAAAHALVSAVFFRSPSLVEVMLVFPTSLVGVTPLFFASPLFRAMLLLRRVVMCPSPAAMLFGRRRT
jgi:hypothetical protein